MMNKPIRILGIAGSLRHDSYNRAALRAATKLVSVDAILETFELDGIPVFNQDEEQKPAPKVSEFKRRIREADAILFVTPEYNYSVPGMLRMRLIVHRDFTVTALGAGNPRLSWAHRPELLVRRGRSTTCDKFSCS
jgi:multimeric flavodoxin WrbA